MRIKVCFLKSHLDTFPENLGSVSDEQEERYHRDIKLWNVAMKATWTYIHT